MINKDLEGTVLDCLTIARCKPENWPDDSVWEFQCGLRVSVELAEYPAPYRGWLLGKAHYEHHLFCWNGDFYDWDLIVGGEDDGVSYATCACLKNE